MAKKSIIGIPRASQFSPNHVGNDAAVFNGTADYLREHGYEVRIRSEQEFLNMRENPERVFTMLRSKQAMLRLQEWESKGCAAVNSAAGILNCERERMTTLLISNNVPYPDSIIANTDEDVTGLLRRHGYKSCWIKRNDVHAIHREDVTYARSPEEVQDMLAEYALRGIKRVVINEHLEGDLVKFYGISGSGFFYWFYPFCGENSHSKFGLEKINGKAREIPFDKERLHGICQKAAEALKLTIYGGDCIVSPDGSIRIIDFNDWPTFAPCRKEAVPEIGKAIVKVMAFQDELMMAGNFSRS